MIDCERSSDTYNIPFKSRIDLFAEMQSLGKEEYKPIDAFIWFKNHIEAIEPGEFRVIAVDPISDIEAGLADYVQSQYADYGFSSGKSFKSMGGVFWGNVNAFWKAFLGKLSAKCEIFAFSTHLRDEYKGDTRTGKKQPKGKQVIAELSSLYIWLTQDVDSKTGKPKSPIPKGTVLKSRLAHTKFVDGTASIIPILPPMISRCCPETIRQYVQKPPDFSKLKKGEYASPEVISEDGKLEMQREIAENNARTAEAQESLATMQLSAAEQVKKRRENSARTEQAESTKGEVMNIAVADYEIGSDDPTPSNPFEVDMDKEAKITPNQVHVLDSQIKDLGFTSDQWTQILKRTGSEQTEDLPFWRAKEINGKLYDMLTLKDLQAGK